MQKILLTAVAASVAGLTSCIPPEPVPPRNPYDSLYGRRPIQNPYDIAPPPESSIPREIAPGIVQPSEPARPTPGTYPVARKTENPNMVISPFEPYEEIDISGFTSGQLVKHPISKRIFRVP